MTTVSAIYGWMFDLISEVWYLPALLLGGYLIVRIVRAIVQGSGV